MSNTIHGVSLSEYAAAIGALTTQAIDNNAILNALNITSEQWTEVCTKYQFAALQNMGTYMQYYSNPALCPKFSYLAGDEKIDTNSEANSAFSQLMNNFSGLFGGGDDDDDDDDFGNIEPVPDDKKELLSIGSIILHQHPTDTFEINGYKSDLKDMLENAWNITDHEDAVEVLE